MDEDDQMAAEAHQQELEARQAEEEAIRKGRELMNQFRADNADFDRHCQAFWERHKEWSL